MHDAITYRGTVYPWHCDHMGHMNVMWYVGKFDEALWSFLVPFGLTPGWLRELHAGDVVLVRSRVTELRERVLRIEQTMFDAALDRPAASMQVTAVHLDTAARRAVPFPAGIAARLAAGLPAGAAAA